MAVARTLVVLFLLGRAAALELCAPRASWASRHAPAFSALDATVSPPSGLWTEALWLDELACERSEVLGVWEEGGALIAFVCTSMPNVPI